MTLLADDLTGNISTQDLRDCIGSVDKKHFDITRYGAVGDGVADDSAAFNSWMAACAGNGICYVPRGTYNIPTASTISVSSNIDIECEDDALFDGGNTDTDRKGPSRGTAPDTVFSMVSAGLEINGCSFQYFDRVIRGTNANVTADIPYIRLDDTHFENVGVALGAQVDGEVDILTELRVTNSTVNTVFGGWGWRGAVTTAYLVGNRGEDIIVAESSNEGTTSTALAKLFHVCFGNDYDESVLCESSYIAGNWVKNIQDQRVKAPDGMTAGVRVSGNNCIIQGNHIEDVTVSDDVNGARGVYLKCRYARVINNTFHDAGEADETIMCKGRESTGGTAGSMYGYGCVIVGNSAFYSGKNTSSGFIGIYADLAIVTNNFVEGCGRKSDEVGGCITISQDNGTQVKHASIIENNIIYNATGNVAIGIRMQGIGLIIRGNVIDGQQGAENAADIIGILLVESSTGAGRTLANVIIGDNLCLNFSDVADDQTCILVWDRDGQDNDIILIHDNSGDSSIEVGVDFVGTPTRVDAHDNSFVNGTDVFRGAEPRTFNEHDNPGHSPQWQSLFDKWKLEFPW